MGLGNSNARANPNLIVKEITDTYLRQNFQNLSDYFAEGNQFLGFKFFDLSFAAAVTNTKVAHGLATIPEDIVVTKIVGSGNVTFNHGLFDATNMDLTVSGPCRIRFYAGSYWNPQTSTASAREDQTTYTASPGGGGSSGTIKQVFLPLTTSDTVIAGTGGNYTIQPADDMIFCNPTSIGQNLILPLASAAPNKVFTIQNMSLTNLPTYIRTAPGTDYVDQPGSVIIGLRLYKAQVKLISDGSMYRSFDKLPGRGFTVTRLTSGTAQTYRKPVGCTWIFIRMVGGGGGAWGNGASGLQTGQPGTNTTFGSLVAGAGGSGNPYAGGPGGTSSGGNILNGTGQPGQSVYGNSAPNVTQGYAANGGGTPFGGGGINQTNGGTPGLPAAPNTGGGGAGGGTSALYNSTSGGGAGAYLEHVYANAADSYLYTVGAGGVGGVGTGAGSGNGGAGGSGLIIVEEHYD